MSERSDALTGGESPLDRVDRADQDASAADPGEIRAEIRDTRERLGDTLEEIGERLNPRTIKEQVKEQARENIRDATIGRVQTMARSAADRVSVTRYTMMDTIRENPVPAALAGIGLGWLFMNRRRQGSYSRPRYGEAGDSYPGAPYGRDRYPGGELGYVGGAEGEQGTMERERAGEVGEKVRDTAGELADRAQGAARQVASRAQDVAGTVADRTRYQARRVEDQFYENPFAIGAATLALGLAAGLALPASEREVSLMGDARDRLVDRVRAKTDVTRDKVQQVAGRVMDQAQTTARDAAREQGLTP